MEEGSPAVHEFPWRDVANQGGCGSCWAFSGVGAIEASLLMNNQTETLLSEQFYVDCAPNPRHPPQSTPFA